MIKPTPKRRSIFSPFSSHRKGPTPIVPKGGVTGTALVVVIAIMTFLAALALGAVDLIQLSAQNWQTQVSREATIQVRPTDGVDMDKTLNAAVHLVTGFHGVAGAQILDKSATERLLEPWLGSNLELDDLPIPRLIVVTLADNATIDFATISDAIAAQIPGGSFDDHRNWINRLVAMAYATVFIGMTILCLVFAALVLTIIFATRSALAGNVHIVEVLHFIGAEQRFVARQFDKHFFSTGFKGSFCGGLAAIAILFIFSFWSSLNMATPQADQASALFGNFIITTASYVKILVLIVFVAFLTMVTSRLTILNQLKEIDRRESDLF